jgi:membrane protein
MSRARDVRAATSWSGVWSLAKATTVSWNRHNCLRLGASLSYYTLFSIFPLILVVLSLLRVVLVNSDAARDAILLALTRVTGGFRDEFITTLEAVATTRRASGIIGTVSLVVSAFNIIWEVDAPEDGGLAVWMRQTFFSLALILAMAFLLLVSMLLTAALTVLTQWTADLPGGVIVGVAIHALINVAALSGVFALLFKYLPQTRVWWRDVWLGAVLTAVLWSALQFAIAWYIAWSGYQNYGSVGAILALVAWVYLSSQVVFLGGEFTAAYARQYGSRAGRTAQSRSSTRQATA